MTRKRFVKLLMSYGVSRNGAEFICEVRPKSKSYAQLYRALLPRLTFRRLIVGISASTAPFYQALSEVADKVKVLAQLLAKKKEELWCF